jgi:hypothetical protein
MQIKPSERNVGLALGALLFLALACQSSSGASSEAGRPAQAGQGEVVARVLLLEGTTQVTAANGFRFPARPGLPLVRTDLLEIAPGGGFLMLELVKNGYLVRLDEDTRLGLAEVVLLDAPPARVGLQEQLSRLMTSEELARGERLAGWHARMRAADSAAPLPVASTAAAEEVDEKAQVPGRKSAPKSLKEMPAEARSQGLLGKVGGGEARPPPAESRAAESTKDVVPVPRPAIVSQVSPAPGGGPAGGAQQEESEPTQGDLPAVRSEEVDKVLAANETDAAARLLLPEGGAVPEPLMDLLGDQAWLACLKAVLAELPAGARPARLAILVEVRGERIRRLRLGGGLPSPACLNPAGLAGEAWAGRADGWRRLELVLP